MKLDLDFNRIGDRGAQFLAELNDTPVLHTLYLNLHHNKIGDVGATALSELKTSASLRVLHLDLSWNQYNDAGVHALGGLMDASSHLRTLRLFLKGRAWKPVGTPMRERLRPGGITHLGDAALWILKNDPRMLPPSSVSWGETPFEGLMRAIGAGPFGKESFEAMGYNTLAKMDTLLDVSESVHGYMHKFRNNIEDVFGTGFAQLLIDNGAFPEWVQWLYRMLHGIRNRNDPANLVYQQHHWRRMEYEWEGWEQY